MLEPELRAKRRRIKSSSLENIHQFFLLFTPVRIFLLKINIYLIIDFKKLSVIFIAACSCYYVCITFSLSAGTRASVTYRCCTQCRVPAYEGRMRVC